MRSDSFGTLLRGMPDAHRTITVLYSENDGFQGFFVHVGAHQNPHHVKCAHILHTEPRAGNSPRPARTTFPMHLTLLVAVGIASLTLGIVSGVGLTLLIQRSANAVASIMRAP